MGYEVGELYIFKPCKNNYSYIVYYTHDTTDFRMASCLPDVRLFGPDLRDFLSYPDDIVHVYLETRRAAS